MHKIQSYSANSLISKICGSQYKKKFEMYIYVMTPMIKSEIMHKNQFI